jgi:hypothetical protein
MPLSGILIAVNVLIECNASVNLVDRYGADFRLGTFGSYVPDETACVRPDGPTYVIYVFGCVYKPIVSVAFQIAFILLVHGRLPDMARWTPHFQD